MAHPAHAAAPPMVLNDNHRLNGRSSRVLTATSHYYGKGQNSTLYKIKTPERIFTKFGTVVYVQRPGNMPPNQIWRQSGEWGLLGESQAERPWVNGDTSFLWERPNFDHLQNQNPWNPWTDWNEIWHSWLRPGNLPQTKFGGDRISGGFWINMWNIPSFVTLFFPEPTWRPHPKPVFAQNGLNDVHSRIDEPFAIKFEIFSNPWSYGPENRQNLALFGTPENKFSLDFTFNISGLRSKHKHPLFFIGAP